MQMQSAMGGNTSPQNLNTIHMDDLQEQYRAKATPLCTKKNTTQILYLKYRGQGIGVKCKIRQRMAGKYGLALNHSQRPRQG